MNYILIISEMFKYGVVTSNQIFKKGGAITLFLIIGLLPITVFSQARSHYTNFLSWSIASSDLKNGNLVLQPDEVKKITYKVVIQRNKDGDGNYDDTPVVFEFLLVNKNSDALSDYNRIQILGDVDAYTDTAEFSLYVGGYVPNMPSNIPYGVSKLVNGDQLILAMTDSDVAGGEVMAPKKYNVIVNFIAGAIKGNSICCNQCILSGETPEPIKQTPGVLLSGTINGNTVWAHRITTYKNSGYERAGWQIYSPGAMDKSTSFNRLLNATEDMPSFNPFIPSPPTTYSGVTSNTVTISISSLKPTLPVATAFYQGNEFIKAGIITIQGDQTINRSRSTPDLQVNFIAARQIIISADTKISDNMHFSIDPSIVSCGTSARIDVSKVDTTLTVIETPQKTTVTTHSENINFLNAYPNPTDGDMIIKYSIAKKGSVKLYISDNLGRLTTTLVDSKTAEPGKYEVIFNSQGAITGVYFCTLISNGYKEVKKLIITNQSQSK